MIDKHTQHTDGTCMKHCTTIGAAWLLALLPAAAMADTPADFTHAIGLTVSGKNAVVQLRLPPAAYLHARSSGLDDLRVFDASGQAMPFALVTPVARSRVNRRELPAAVFPINAVSAAAASRHDVEIRTSADGAVTAITARHGGARDGATALHALVLDFGRASAGQHIDALVFALPEGVTNYQAQVALEVSDDLRNWDTAGYGTLSWLSNQQQETLVSNRMEFAPRSFRYARLTWREGTPIKFAAVTAQAPGSVTVNAAMDSITLQPRPGRFANDLVYDAAPAIPAERLSLRFGPGNVVMPAQLGHYIELPSTKGKAVSRWEFSPRLAATFFQIEQNGQQRRSGDVLTDAVHAAQWVLRPQSALPNQPSLTLSWTPATMVFMAGGTPPYSLYVGSAKAKPAQRAIAQVAPGFTEAEVQSLEMAVAGPARVNTVAAGQASDAAQASASARGRMALLWGVLLLGVGVLGVMVWKLTRQMKAPD